MPHVKRMQQAVAATLLVAVASAVSASQVVNPQAAALADFQQRLNGYLKLRADLADKLKSLSPTPSASELSARQESLAAGLRAARKAAKQGEMIPPPVAEQIAKTVQDDFRRRNPDAVKATLAEVPDVPRPTINRTYPENAALPTIPPLLLKSLPLLPDNLQYRFYGRHVVLLDGDTQIIVDYIPNVLPPH
jgi:hypothetical protein